MIEMITLQTPDGVRQNIPVKQLIPCPQWLEKQLKVINHMVAGERERANEMIMAAERLAAEARTELLASQNIPEMAQYYIRNGYFCVPLTAAEMNKQEQEKHKQSESKDDGTVLSAPRSGA